MRIKKIVALATAMVMLMTTATSVFASEVTEPTGSDSGTVGSDSTYVDMEKYKVTLPTSTSLDFNIDPEGLYGYFSANDGETAVDDADLTAYKGKVVASKTALVTNKSSIPIVVTCEFSVSTTANIAFKTLADTLVEENNELALGIMPCTSDGEATPTYTAVATNALSIDSTSAAASDKILFALGAADYEFTSDGTTYDYVQKAEAVGVTTATYAYFQIGGNVSKDADWSELTGAEAKTVDLGCVFSYVGAESITDSVAADSTAVVTDASKIEYLTVVEPTVAPTPTEAAAEPTIAPTEAPVGPTACNLRTIVSSVGADVTSSITADKGIYIYTGGAYLTTTADKLTSLKVNGVAKTPATTGISAGNGGALYFKLPVGSTLDKDDVVTVVVDGTTYTFTVAN